MRQFLVWFMLRYLKIAAKIQLAKIAPKHIIGITGSAGKSSCREAIYAILKDKYSVKQSSSGNSETGLPLDILGFSEDHNYSNSYWLKIFLLTPIKLLTNWQKYDIYVAEMGVDSPKEPRSMSYLLKILKPDIGVLLNVLPVHTEYFDESNVAAIALEKGKLILNLTDNGYAILNADDPRVIALADKTKAHVITFGEETKADVKNFVVDIPGFVIADNFGYTLAATAAVGKIFGLNLTEVKNLLRENFKLPPGRGSIFNGINNSLIIDSSYNASKIPMIAALKVLENYKGMRKIAVLGDMRELGNLAKSEHEEVAAEAVNDADYIFTFGPLMDEYFYPKAISLGFNHKKIYPHTKMSLLVEDVKKFIKPNDIILVKGSQNTILLETLVESLLANPEDKSKLCRRGKFWDKKRQELLNNNEEN